MSYENADLLKQFVTKVIDQRLKELGMLQGFLEPGVVENINGNRADIFINNSSTITPNVPINDGLTLAQGDEVWILKINFSHIDKLILCKRPI